MWDKSTFIERRDVIKWRYETFFIDRILRGCLWKTGYDYNHDNVVIFVTVRIIHRSDAQ